MSRKYFGTDGIRDAVGAGNLAPERVRVTGRAVGAWLLATAGRAGRVLAGLDTRASGPGILAGLAEGLRAHGHEVVDGGVLPTPAVQALCRDEGYDLAIVVSASHNPARDNGIKFFGADGRKLGDASEQAIEALMDGPPSAPAAGTLAGKLVADPGAGDRYLATLGSGDLSGLDLAGWTVVLDCANGAASELAPRALRDFGAEVLVRGAEPDGQNINAGCGVFHVADLGEEVRASGAVLGMALDGDADRVLFVDETGAVREGDHVLGLLAADLKERRALEGDLLVTTVMANMGLSVFLQEHGVTLESVSVGDRFVAARMDATGAVLGGEQSGHVIFRREDRWSGDGLYTALRVLEVMRRTGRPLSDLARGIEKYPQRLINVEVSSKPPLAEVGDLLAATAEAEASFGGAGRVVLRYSGTESLLRVMVEGRDGDQVEAVATRLAEQARELLGS